MSKHIKSLRSFFDRPTEVVVKEGAIHLAYATLLLATGVLHGIEVAISILHNYTDETLTKVDPSGRRQSKKIGSFLHEGKLAHPLLTGRILNRGSGGPPTHEIAPSSVSDQPAAEVLVSTPLSTDENTEVVAVTQAPIEEVIPNISQEVSEDPAALESWNEQALATV